MLGLVSAVLIAAAGNIGYVESLQWRNGADKTISARGLYVFQGTDAVYTTRILVELEKGTRGIFTQQWIASRGVSRAVLVDDASGWWVELEKAFPVRGKTVRELFESMTE